MNIKKIVKYFFLSALVLFITAIVIVVFFIKTIANFNKPPFISDLINKLKKPEPVVIVPAEEKTVRILEGWNLRDIADVLKDKEISNQEEFFKIAGKPQTDYRRVAEDTYPFDFSKEFSFLTDKPKHYGLEGYLFPDTYRVYASSTPVDVVRRFLSNFDKKLTPALRQEISKQGRTIYEVITLASLIEKEAPIDYQSGDNTDAKLIAGIFLNRLEIGQGLQADATLSYIFDDNKPAHSGTELEVDSPYNTYKYRGLPPGPICNPGILAIEAAVYPTESDYYYFLTPKGKREVIYARTYEEHLSNKYKYLR